MRFRRTHYIALRPSSLMAGIIRRFGEPCFGITATESGGTRVTLGRRIAIGRGSGPRVEFSTQTGEHFRPSEAEGYALIEKHLAGA
jgi:hypothetical protein